MQLLQELQRISGNPVLIESGRKKWQNITDKIAAQASIEAEHSDRLSDVLSSVSTCHGMSFLLVFFKVVPESNCTIFDSLEIYIFRYTCL